MVQTLDDAVGLRAFDFGPLVLDAFELKEQVVGMLVLAATEFRDGDHKNHRHKERNYAVAGLNASEALKRQSAFSEGSLSTSPLDDIIHHIVKYF